MGPTTAMVKAAERSLEVDRRQDRVMQKWLSGFTLQDIAASEKVEKTTILRDIGARRKDLRTIYEGDVNELAAERIEGLRAIQRDAIVLTNQLPDKSPAFLTVRLRAEETIAKIQGVLNDKVVHLGRIEHHVKVYDFTDNFPDPVGLDASVIDSTGVLLQEPEGSVPLDSGELLETSTARVVVEIRQPVEEVKVSSGNWLNLKEKEA